MHLDMSITIQVKNYLTCLVQLFFLFFTNLFTQMKHQIVKEAYRDENLQKKCQILGVVMGPVESVSCRVKKKNFEKESYWVNPFIQ